MAADWQRTLIDRGRVTLDTLRSSARELLARALSAPRSSPPPRAETHTALDRVNDQFHEAHEAARDEARHEAPVFVVVGDALVVFRHGQREAFSFSPRAFHLLKSVAHAPIALYALVERADDSLNQALTALRARVAQSLETALATPASDDVQFVLTATRDAIDRALAGHTALDAFAQRVGPALLRLAQAATQLQLDALHAHTELAVAQLTPAEREQLHVVVAGDHQARVRSLAMQYFKKRLREPAESETRVSYAEGVADERGALALVGAQRLDRSLARAFFGDEKRLQRDILGDAATDLLATFDV